MGVAPVPQRPTVTGPIATACLLHTVSASEVSPPTRVTQGCASHMAAVVTLGAVDVFVEEVGVGGMSPNGDRMATDIVECAECRFRPPLWRAS